jgi:tetratricopeptide (TPR) repeat protein
MTEQEYISRIIERWPSGGQLPSHEILELALEAVARYPLSPKLLCLRGDLYQLEHRAWSNSFDPNIPLLLYQHALSLDAGNADALTEIGFIYDIYFQDFSKAEAAFRSAISIGADHASYFGLARVLSQMGRSHEASDLLRADRCPYFDHPDIKELRSEISQGVWDKRDGI